MKWMFPMFFQGLFRNFSDAFLPLLQPYMERLVADSHESKQRCVAEIISGLIRGCKHWSYTKVHIWNSQVVRWLDVSHSLGNTFLNLSNYKFDRNPHNFIVSALPRSHCHCKFLLIMAVLVPFCKEVNFVFVKYLSMCCFPGWEPLGAAVSTAPHCPVQHHSRNLCGLGHLHRHSLCKPFTFLTPIMSLSFYL